MPNIFAECLLAALRFLALWIIFYLLHHPRTTLRHIMAIGMMVMQYPFCRILYFASGRNFAASVTCDTLLFLTLAFICEAEPTTVPRSGDDFRPLPAGENVKGDLMRPVIKRLVF